MSDGSIEGVPRVRWASIGIERASGAEPGANEGRSNSRLSEVAENIDAAFVRNRRPEGSEVHEHCRQTAPFRAGTEEVPVVPDASLSARHRYDCGRALVGNLSTLDESRTMALQTAKRLQGEMKMRFDRSFRWAFRATLFFVSALAIFSFGCAEIEYRKVPTPSQYKDWDDEKQREADAMEGVRYYLPRPFVHLKQPVAVAQRVAFLSFRRDGNGYVLETPERNPTWVTKVAPKRISITQALAAMLAANAVETRGANVEQSGSVDDNAASMPSTADQKPPTTLQGKTGFINKEDPVTKLSAILDVVYLPDMEEQYVIQPNVGLGTADLEFQLRNGWAAEVFSQKVDNSNLIPYVIDQVENASTAALNIAKNWAPAAFGLPSLPAMQQSGTVAEDGSVDATKVSNFLGEILLFKIAEVKIAQPGLYPILKPREIRDHFEKVLVQGADAEDAFEKFLTQNQTTWIRPDMAFIPCPPFTMVGFNCTTDVFLAPATQQIQLPKSEEFGPHDEASRDSSPEKKIKAALVGKTLGSTKISESNIEVRAGDDSASSVIIVKSLLAPFSEGVDGQLKTLITSNLNVAEDKVTCSIEDGGKFVKAAVTMSLVDIAKGL